MYMEIIQIYQGTTEQKYVLFPFTCISVLGSSWTGPKSCISTSPVPYTSGSESLLLSDSPKEHEVPRLSA